MEITIKNSLGEGTVVEKTRFHVTENLAGLKILVELAESMWFAYQIKDTNGKIRGQYIGPNTPYPVTIGRDQLLSPNTVAGELPAGEWEIEIFCHPQKLLEKEQELATIEVFELIKIDQVAKDEIRWHGDELTDLHLNQFPWAESLETGLRWYKGDLHTHTTYSDGKMSREDNLQQAKEMNLDFFVATDHNIVPTSGLLSDDILVIPGIEITSPHGHYNQLGVRQHPLAKEGYATLTDEQKLSDSFLENALDGHLNSINHPYLSDWKWLAGSTVLAHVDCLEIWNDPTFEFNPGATEKALLTWDRLLTDGQKIVGVGGSDSHLRPEEAYPNSSLPSLIGDPATYVYSQELSSNQILKNIKAGHVFVSRFDCQVDFTVAGKISGEELPLTEKEFTASCQLANLVDPIIEWVVDGQIVQRDHAQHATYPLSIEDQGYHYIRINVRNQQNELIAFTNPVFRGTKTPEILTWAELQAQE